jgi:hypothetical protein
VPDRRSRGVLVLSIEGGDTEMRKLLLAGVLLLSACQTVLPKAGPPVPLSVDKDSNPDVIWIVREVAATGPMNEQRTLWGLFACYRQPPERASAPVCFLAEHASTPDGLSWPGALDLGSDGVLRPRKENSRR